MNINVDITYKLLVTARMLEKVGDMLFSKFGITARSFEILKHINSGINTTTMLADAMQSSLANITHGTKILEEKGYIKRIVNERDKRIWCFSITKKGQGLLETVNSIYEAGMIPLYSQVPAKQKQRILDFLNATEEHLKVVIQDDTHIAEFMTNLLEAKTEDNL